MADLMGTLCGADDENDEPPKPKKRFRGNQADPLAAVLEEGAIGKVMDADAWRRVYV